MFRRHHRAFDCFVLPLEVITDICHGYPFHTWLFADIFNQPTEKIELKAAPNYSICSKRDSPFQHENYMWMPTDIRMDGHRKAEVVILPVEVIKVVPPQVLHISGINPAM